MRCTASACVHGYPSTSSSVPTAPASVASTPRTRRVAPEASAPPISAAGPIEDDRFAAGVQLALGFQLLQHAAGHLARTADQARELLAGHPQLRALRVAHRLRLAGQVVQRAQ